MFYLRFVILVLLLGLHIAVSNVCQGSKNPCDPHIDKPAKLGAVRSASTWNASQNCPPGTEWNDNLKKCQIITPMR